MFPLLICLLNLNDMGEEAATDFGECDLVLYHGVDPVLFVLEGQVDDESAALCKVLF